MASTLLFIAATAGCGGGAFAGGSEGQTPSGSYASASGSSLSSTNSGLAAPDRAGPGEDYVVRPDRLAVGLALRMVSADAPTALDRLHAEMNAVVKRLSEAAGAPASVTLCGAAVSSPNVSKASRGDDEEHAITLESTVDLPLPPEDGFARSRILVAVSAAMRGMSARHDGEDEGLSIAMNGPRPYLADVEPHRAKLIARWVAQARAFADVAQSEAAELAIVDCTPPGAIEQVVLSSEEVVLRLPISCRIDVAPRRE